MGTWYMFAQIAGGSSFELGHVEAFACRIETITF